MSNIGDYPTKETIVNSDSMLVYSSNGQTVKVPFNTLLPYITASYIQLEGTPGTFVGQQGKVPQVNSTETALEFVASGLAPTFLVLPDTPSSYSGQAGKLVKVNDANKGLEFVDIEDAVPGVTYVTTATDLSGTLSSTEIYVIAGVIDMGAIQIEVPQGGLNLHGHSFDVSKLTSSENSYTMFTSPVGGSGDLLGDNYAIEVTGTGSQVYDLVADTGGEAFEFYKVNYNNCTSLGTIEGYRQGLEDGTGRFGGTPTLTLVGAWAGGYRATTSITRSLDNAMNAPLFEAGAGFTMGSRFLTDMNVDLGSTASFADFAEANFPISSTLQIQGSIISRNGVFDSDDTTIMPNILASNLSCAWKNNIGLPNTFEGGRAVVTTELETTINTLGVFEDIAGTWTASELQHFDSPSNGQLRHLGITPREYKVSGDLAIDGDANDDLTVKLVKWDDSASAFVDIGEQTRTVNNFTGGRDVAFFNSSAHVNLDQNDYLKLQVANESGTDNVTAELSSYLLIEER